jgi:hypothetical protein
MICNKKISAFLDKYCYRCKQEKTFRKKNKESCFIANNLVINKVANKGKIIIDSDNNISCKDFKSA